MKYYTQKEQKREFILLSQELICGINYWPLIISESLIRQNESASKSESLAEFFKFDFFY